MKISIKVDKALCTSNERTKIESYPTTLRDLKPNQTPSGCLLLSKLQYELLLCDKLICNAEKVLQYSLHLLL